MNLDLINTNKILLFFSAYSPLLIFISIKVYFLKINYYLIHILFLNFSFEVPIKWGSVIFLFIFSLLVIYPFFILYKSKSITFKPIKVKKIDEKTDMILSYLFPYIISFTSFDTLEELFYALIIFLFIFLIYIKSDILFINPFFIFAGYKFYYLYTEKSYILVLSKKDLYRSIDDTIYVKQIGNRLFIFE